MGADKALVPVDGRPMAVRVADALWEAGCHPVWCQGGDADALASLGLEVHPDRLPGEGPVFAIHDALNHAASDIVVTACDLVDLDAETVRAVIDGGRAAGPDVVAVASASGRHHLLSYWPRSVAGRLEVLVAEGVRSYGDALAAFGAVDVEVEPVAIRNINRTDDLGRRG